MSIEFFLASLILAMIPGTGVLFVISCGLGQGRRGALWGAVAGALGVIPHIFAVGLSLAVLLQTSDVAFEVLRVLGAVYLLYLAYQTFRSAKAGLDQSTALRLSASNIVLRGVLINLLNPKLTLFFFAFIPQFMTHAMSSTAQEVILMGAVLVGQTFVVFLIYGVSASWMRDRLLANHRYIARSNYVIASLFALVGIRLLIGNALS